MTEHKWKARTKRDLMIEVWESLDCESVGASELQAIQIAVRNRFGDGAVESPASAVRPTLDEAVESIGKLEELRKTFVTACDKTGLRRVRESALNSKQGAQLITDNKDVDEHTRSVNREIVEWLILWLQQPELFETWLDLRRSTSEFRERFQKT